MPDGALVKAQVREWDGPVYEDEAVELFLMPPHMKGGYVQFQINADGSVADKRVTVTLNELKIKVAKRDRAWNAEKITVETTRQDGVWELEAAVSRSSLGAVDWRGTWRVNVCRDFKGPVGSRELSSILPPSARNFHDTSAFPQLIFHPQPAGEPHAEISVMGFRHQTRTLDDRVATICEFGLQCRANRVLHDVRITAETYDRSGRLHLRQVVKRLDHLTFVWQSDRDLSVGFEQQIEAGGVRLVLESDEVRVERWIRIAGWQGTPEIGTLFAPGVAGQGLRGLCHLPAQIMTPGAGKPTRLVPQRRGAIECWFKHDWRPPHPLADATPWMPRFVLLHSGVLRREHPEHFNHSSLTLYHGLGSGTMYLSARNRSYAGWHTHGQCEAAKGWLKPGWHHVACVWDYEAAPADQLRLYINGVRSSVKTVVSKPERLRDQAIALAPTPFATQLGSLNTGRHLAPVVLDELRISRSARYVNDFAPKLHPHELDKDTSARFHFDRDLDGEGMTETGERYPVRGQAGALALH